MASSPCNLAADNDGLVSTFLAQERPDPQDKTVLLAEDDSCLRPVMDSVLTWMGYRVIACADARLALIAFHVNPVDLLLTDFEMPGKTGMELAQELTTLRSTLPVIVLTGCALSLEAVTEIREREWLYLRKPCSSVSLQAHLSRMLRPGQIHA